MLRDIPGTTSVERVGEFGITATIASEIDGALRKLLQRPSKDIQIEHATLEEIFLEYYGHIEREAELRYGRAPGSEAAG